MLWLEELGFGDPRAKDLLLGSREWKNGSNSSYNCTPFLHSLLTKGRKSRPGGAGCFSMACHFGLFLGPADRNEHVAARNYSLLGFRV